MTETPEPSPELAPALAEIEAHVHAAGWDRSPTLFALVRTAQFVADDPATAARLGIDSAGAPLTPVEQDALPDKPLDEVLAGIAWPDEVVGCALTQEIVVLPPAVEAELADGGDMAGRAANHPQRREARLTVGVLRDGASAALLRLRATGPEDDDLLTGPDLAPNLVAALLATLE